jgi:hypothetical protein
LAFTFARQHRIQVDGDAILSADARQQIAALLRRIARPTLFGEARLPRATISSTTG